MKNSEQAIEQVLTALRYSEAPPGMEQRILAATQRDLSARHPRTLRAALIVLFGAAVAVVATIAVIHWHQPIPTQSTHHGVPTASPSLATSGEGAEDAYPVSHDLVSRDSAPSASAKSPTRKPRLIGASYFDTRHEMRAPSHPAPTAPLTEEEKLLLRIARTGDPDQIAMLNPAIRAKREAEDEAEFQKFVERSNEEDLE